MELKSLGVEELEACNQVFDFTKREPVSDIIQKRIIEFLKAGRRFDARDAIWHISDLNRKQAYYKICDLEKLHVLKYDLNG